MKTSQRIYLPFKGPIGILGYFAEILVRFVFLWRWAIPVDAHSGIHLIECVIGPSIFSAKLLGIERGR